LHDWLKNTLNAAAKMIYWAKEELRSIDPFPRPPEDPAANEPAKERF
jgi:hypothetical protein